MDREQKGIKKLFNKIASKEGLYEEVNEKKFLYSLIGFIPSTDFVDNALLISNLGYLLTQKDINVCILDFKVFSPNIYQYLDVEPHKKGNGLIRLLKSDKCDVREEVQRTKYDNLFLVSPSPYDLIEEYFDFTLNSVERVLKTLKEMFDIVLIDIPNIPPLEFCFSAIQQCHLGFFTSAERTETSINMMKFLDYFSSVGISTTKLTNVIIMNTQELNYDYKVLGKYGFEVVTSIPFVREAISLALDGKLYVKDNVLLNKYFINNMQILVDKILS